MAEGGAKSAALLERSSQTIPGSDFVGIPYAEEGNVCLTRTPFGGFPFLGKYEYDDFGTPSEPVVELWPEGQTSYFQAHGVTKRTIEWGVAIDPEGHPVGQQTDFGALVYLFYKYTGTGMPAPARPARSATPMTPEQSAPRWGSGTPPSCRSPEISTPRCSGWLSIGERFLACADAAGTCGLPVTPKFTWSH